MIDALLRTIVRLLLALRYRVRVRGLERVVRRGTHGVLFLPNHPALIDPIIVMSVLHKRFRPRALADRDQIDVPVVREIARHVGIIPLPDVKVHGAAAAEEVQAARRTALESLRDGGCMLMYPSGHIYRTRLEDLRGNSGAAELMIQAPRIRVVLVRTRGLWGSRLSMASGEFPHLARLLRRTIGDWLRSYLFFMPRRDVTIEFFEPDDLPSPENREALNAYMERFYNADAPPATWRPYAFGESPREAELPEPNWGRRGGDVDVPDATRATVVAHLRELSGVEQIRAGDSLARDLGLDSLARAELLLWLGREFGHDNQDGDAIQTVGDLMMAACGKAIVTRPISLDRPPRAWSADLGAQRVHLSDGATIAEVFLAAARHGPGRLVLADQLRGGLTYRQMVLGILALKPEIERLAGECVGIMLPASVGATAVYFATLFAGKTPLLVNWTTGRRNLLHTCDITGVRHILTSATLAARLDAQGVELDGVRERFVMLEELGQRLTWRRKLGALLRSYVDWSSLTRAKVTDTAAILVTSGSESLPKAVPLSHANILANLRDVLSAVEIRRDDRLIAFLPPFHSFGLTVTTVLPAIAGIRTVYHANPTEAFVLGRLIKTYGVTVMLGTPTFLSGILRAAPDTDTLKTLRLAVTGAEKCPEAVYAALARQCPGATVLEGYGITECSPIVSVNRAENPRPGTIGQPLPSVEHVIVDIDSGEVVARGGVGMLLVRGPSIFDGYLGDSVVSPFVEHAGKQWYRTGDLVSEDDEGVMTFRGRLKRFIKIGGEMVSLPAIEGALAPHLASPDDDGPVFAVEASADDARPEIVLFATGEIDRQAANGHVRAAGLSALHNVSRVVRLDEIPLLGNGKTDYRALKQMV